MMSYEEFTQKEAALESAPQAEREAFYAEILEKETAKTDVRMMAYFHAALLHYREGDFRAAREILEPFVIDYQSYAYRPEIIACFNLMGVAVYCERSYALARFYIHEGLKIARENHEISRYSYEYNNLAVTYLAQHEYEKALEAIREAKRHLPDSDWEMHAYIYRNLSEICCHLDRLDEAQAALTRCVEEYDGRTLLPDDILLVEMLLYYKLGDAERYEKCRAEVWQKLPAMHAAEFGNTANNLFEAFTQGDNAARSQYGGTGLGMSISYLLMTQMGGSITVESEPGCGSCFTVIVTLPTVANGDELTPAQAPSLISSSAEGAEGVGGAERAEGVEGETAETVRVAETAETVEAPGAPGAVRALSSPSGAEAARAPVEILVAEDNELNADIISSILTEEGFSITVAENGEEAVRLFSESPVGHFAAILMDAQMPVMDGYEASRAIRDLKRADAKTVRIFACTASTFAEDRNRALASGMDDFLSKPLNVTVMLQKLEAVRKGGAS